MKYIVENKISAPLQKVVDKFSEPEGALEWMAGLKKIEHLSGEPFSVGATTDFHYLFKKKEMKISETILESNLPKSVKFAYQSPMGYNEVELFFEKIDDNTTRQISHSFFDMKGGKKILGWIFQSVFKKQSLKYMDGFKAYVEK
jgi:hypothetical protein